MHLAMTTVLVVVEEEDHEDVATQGLTFGAEVLDLVCVQLVVVLLEVACQELLVWVAAAELIFWVVAAAAVDGDEHSPVPKQHNADGVEQSLSHTLQAFHVKLLHYQGLQKEKMEEKDYSEVYRSEVNYLNPLKWKGWSWHELIYEKESGDLT